MTDNCFTARSAVLKKKGTADVSPGGKFSAARAASFCCSCSRDL